MPLVPISERLALDEQTVPLAELLLTKLQIVQLNAKDVSDILALLVEHDVGEAMRTQSTRRSSRTSSPVTGGFGATMQGSLAKVRAALPASGLSSRSRRRSPTG